MAFRLVFCLYNFPLASVGPNRVLGLSLMWEKRPERTGWKKGRSKARKKHGAEKKEIKEIKGGEKKNETLFGELLPEKPLPGKPNESRLPTETYVYHRLNGLKPSSIGNFVNAGLNQPW